MGLNQIVKLCPGMEQWLGSAGIQIIIVLANSVTFKLVPGFKLSLKDPFCTCCKQSYTNLNHLQILSIETTLLINFKMDLEGNLS